MSLVRFEQLDVWRESHALVLKVYQLTSRFPSEERFGLSAQMRRAAVSVPANIAEGFKRRGAAEKARFYNISQGSLEELRYYLMLCRDLGYGETDGLFFEQCERIGKMLSALILAVRA